MPDHRWTEDDFDEMSWHDNHVHGLRVVEGEYGPGGLILDLDYILEWINCGADHWKFRILPASLEFREVSNLRIALDYATPTAALGPFSIHAIERRMEQRERYQAQVWTIVINWPVGEISFEANGFEQRGTAEPRIVDEQRLPAADRG